MPQTRITFVICVLAGPSKSLRNDYQTVVFGYKTRVKRKGYYKAINVVVFCLRNENFDVANVSVSLYIVLVFYWFCNEQ